MFSKKGYILSPADLFKGLVIGFFIGAATVYLMMNGYIPNPFIATAAHSAGTAAAASGGSFGAAVK